MVLVLSPGIFIHAWAAAAAPQRETTGEEGGGRFRTRQPSSGGASRQGASLHTVHLPSGGLGAQSSVPGRATSTRWCPALGLTGCLGVERVVLQHGTAIRRTTSRCANELGITHETSNPMKAFGPSRFPPVHTPAHC